MGRPRKTDRHDDFDEPENEAAAREAPRDDAPTFETEMFTDDVQSPLHIPRSDWPDGLAMRWISVEVAGAQDNKNWSMKTAAHWTPVARGKYPHIDKRFPTTPMPGTQPTDGGAIVFGGLCLCERDARYNTRDRKAQEKATQDSMKTIETYVEGGNSMVPRFNQSSPIQHERGVRRAQFKE